MYKKLKADIENLKTGGYQITEFYSLYGQCQMAWQLNAISKDQFMDLNHDVMAEGINNSKYMNNLDWTDIGAEVNMDRRTASRKFYGYFKDAHNAHDNVLL